MVEDLIERQDRQIVHRSFKPGMVFQDAPEPQPAWSLAITRWCELAGVVLVWAGVCALPVVLWMAVTSVWAAWS